VGGFPSRYPAPQKRMRVGRRVLLHRVRRPARNASSLSSCRSPPWPASSSRSGPVPRRPVARRRRPPARLGLHTDLHACSPHHGRRRPSSPLGTATTRAQLPAPGPIRSPTVPRPARTARRSSSAPSGASAEGGSTVGVPSRACGRPMYQMTLLRSLRHVGAAGPGVGCRADRRLEPTDCGKFAGQPARGG